MQWDQQQATLVKKFHDHTFCWTKWILVTGGSGASLGLISLIFMQFQGSPSDWETLQNGKAFSSQGKVAAGPGFHRVGAPSRRGRQPTIWPKFAKNCMKIKKIGPRVGTHTKLYYVDPPLKSQGILNRLEKSGKITQYTGKLREFSLSNFLFPRYFPLF